MAAYLRQSLAGLLPSEREAIEQECFAPGTAIGVIAAINYLEYALARAQRRAEDIEQAASREEFVVGAGEAVSQGTDIEARLGVHAPECAVGTDASVTPFVCK